jgi:hypothetical protein
MVQPTEVIDETQEIIFCFNNICCVNLKHILNYNFCTKYNILEQLCPNDAATKSIKNYPLKSSSASVPKMLVKLKWILCLAIRPAYTALDTRTQ